MTHTIEQALGDQYLMFYHAAWPVEDLRPGCTLAQCVETVNYHLKNNGRNLSTWSEHAQDEAARLLWVNWMYQRLGVEPIRKPIVVHQQQNQFVVDCGDTRLMSLNLLIDPGVVGVVCTVPKSHAQQFKEWTPICNNQELLQAAGFGRNAHVLVRPGTGQAIDWLEIGDHTTAHHLHDIGQRVAMMQRYIDTQEDTFEFSVDWARNYINWDIYSR